MSIRRKTGLEWLSLLRRRFANLAVEVDLGSDSAREFLAAQHAEAVAVCDENGATLLFRDAAPSASAVLEEFAHALQHRRQLYAEWDVVEMTEAREIDVKECLLANAGHFSNAENVTSAELLERHRQNFRRLKERWT